MVYGFIKEKKKKRAKKHKNCTSEINSLKNGFFNY